MNKRHMSIKTLFLQILKWPPIKSNPYSGLDRPFGLQEVEAPRISRQSVIDGVKFVIPKHRSHLPPQELPLILISVAA
jgi:hypothetical protein